jgi:predicted DNA-binding protein with PD1-like motif
MTVVRAIIALLITSFTLNAQPSRGSFYALRLQPHQDLRKSILEFVKTNELKAAAIVSCVGSLERVALRFANQAETTHTEGFFEITSLVGTIEQDYCHLHLSVADSKGKTMGGHLMEGATIYTTAEIVLVDLVDF